MAEQENYEQIKVEAQPLGLFETPIAYCALKNADPLLDELEATIRSKKANDGGIARSNIGSWHSDTDMMTWGGPAAIKVAETAVKIAKRMSHFQDSSPEQYDWIVRMWANVTPKGGLNHLHSHPGNLWAAVLYVDMGGDSNQGTEDVGGRFYLEDPRFPMAAMKDTSFRLIGQNDKPQQYETELRLERGNLVVFPAWARHGVRHYKGDRERISIAMNIDAQRRP